MTTLITDTACSECGKTQRLGLRYFITTLTGGVAMNNITNQADLCSMTCVGNWRAHTPIENSERMDSRCANCNEQLLSTHYIASIIGPGGFMQSPTLCSPLCVHVWAIDHASDDILYYDDEDDEDEDDEDEDDEDDDEDEDMLYYDDYYEEEDDEDDDEDDDEENS